MKKSFLAIGILLFCILLNTIDTVCFVVSIPLGLFALWMLYSEYKKDKNQ